MKFITLNGTRYRIMDMHLEGYTEAPVRRNGKLMKFPREIYIDSHEKGKRKHLEIAIHEAIHAMDPQATEGWVERAGHEVARLVWGLGYRLK